MINYGRLQRVGFPQSDLFESEIFVERKFSLLTLSVTKAYCAFTESEILLVGVELRLGTREEFLAY